MQFLVVMFTLLETNVVPLFNETCSIKELKAKEKKRKNNGKCQKLVLACEQAFPRYFSPNREPVHRLASMYLRIFNKTVMMNKTVPRCRWSFFPNASFGPGGTSIAEPQK